VGSRPAFVTDLCHETSELVASASTGRIGGKLRVLIHVDTDKRELLVNNRFAYVSVSRAQHDAQIYTNDGSKLSDSLRRESSQRAAGEVEQQPAAPKTEPVSSRGVRPSEEEQGHSLRIGLRFPS
jgi:hypothetical protein